MNIVFCVDRSALPGLHVAAYTLLERLTSPSPSLFVFSDELTEADLALLDATLSTLGKPFTLEMRPVNARLFAGYPPLNGNWASYYRLTVPQSMDVERFLYVDADTLCDIDVSPLDTLDMGLNPAGFVPESTLATAVDRYVVESLGNSQNEPYFNAGVMLVNVAQWRKQQVTERAMEYMASNCPPFHDQSALNVVLHRNICPLPPQFNCIANVRRNWPSLRRPRGQIGQLVHFLDYPKPWDFLGEFVHPQYRLWRSVSNRTAMKDFSSLRDTARGKWTRALKSFAKYRKSLKDRLLFTGYCLGILKRVKGVK